ncbi:mucin-5AC-like [Rhagoletis pomonella]|uniref:mucin-5AC-like n=1 Tax=Rhagoletis pomonella TaxID=28610 RepID=UPI00177EEF86|nr:mucin-5AC-like [Rhagoletis pomonella]
MVNIFFSPLMLPHSITGEELAFIFGAPLAPAGPFPSNSYGAQEKLLSEAVMTYWTNFAKTGNPKAPWKGNFINLHALEWDRYDLDWPEFNKRTQAYMNIGIPPSIGYKYRQIYMNFWNKELPDELNQIANIQRQPSGGGSEVITGHMSQFGTRDNGAEDPVRTLKLLLQEPWKMGGSSEAGASSTNGGGVVGVETLAENMYNAPPTFGVAKHADDEQLYALTAAGNAASIGSASSAGNKEEVAKSEATIQLLIGLIAVFIVLNVIIYSTFLLQKKKKAHKMQRKLGGILSYDGTTDDEFKRSKQNDGDESYILDIVRKSNTYEAVKTERSPINGFQMTRQLSTSTVDAHTKVCAWMSAAAGAAAEAKACAGGGGADSSKGGSKKSSSPTFSSLRSSSAGGSFKQPVQPQKVSVAVDATPQTRSSSVLEQEPIEALKLKADGRNIIICQEVEVVDQELLTPQNSLDSSRYTLVRQHSAATEPCEAELPQQGQLPIYKQTPQHAHSHSDPVDMQHYYSSLCGATTEQDEKVTSFVGEDINVTSRDDDDAAALAHALTPAQQLQVIKSRNYPKVLPTTKATTTTTTNADVKFLASADDSPPMTLDLRTTNKRNSLPPNSFLPHFGSTMGGSMGARYPPLPPPRTISTLGRKPSQRRNSSNITTSPLMLAHDCTAEEEEEPPITQNTLIVGPLIPQQKQKMCGGASDANYSTLKRNEAATTDKAAVIFNSLPSSRVKDAKTTQTTTAMHSISGASLAPTNTQIGSKTPTITTAGVTGVTTFLSSGADAGLQSFESRPISSVGVDDKFQQQQQQQNEKQQPTHHTERVYAIQQPATANLLAMQTGSQTGTATNVTPTLITAPVMNLTGHQNVDVHNNFPTKRNNSNNNSKGINADISDIYAQPNKSTIKAKTNLTAPKLSAPAEQSTRTPATSASNPSTHQQKTSTIGAIAALARLPGYTTTAAAALKPIATTDEAAAKASQMETATKTQTTEMTAANLDATQLTNSGVDKQVTAMSMQTMESLAAEATATATPIALAANNTKATAVGGGGGGRTATALPHMLNIAEVGSLQAQLDAQKQQSQQQQLSRLLSPTSTSTATAMDKTTTMTGRVPPVSCMSTITTATTTTGTTTTIANAIAAQLAQTKPLKAALAANNFRGAVVASQTSILDGADSGAASAARDSCHSSVSTSSAGSSADSTCSSASSGSATSSNASAATGTSSTCSSLSSTGTVRTELKQKTNGSGRPTQL